jgi:N-acyl-D-glutamate deacylase
MELLAVQTLAAKYEVPTYWHVRSEGEYDPLSAEQAYGEAISCAACTGSWLHICHLNSTSFYDIERAARMVQSAQKQGLKITVEAYPYGAASTAIGAATLAPENLPRTGMTYESIEYEGRRLNEQTYNELRLKNPGAIVVVHFLELPRDRHCLMSRCYLVAPSSLRMRCHGSARKPATMLTITHGLCLSMLFPTRAVLARMPDFLVNTYASAG